MFEHTVTYVPVRYQEAGIEGGIIFRRRGIPVQPDPESLWENPQFERHFLQMGQQGWELVNTQPLLKGQYRSSGRLNTSFGLGYSLTDGYYFFWKRAKADV